MPRWHCHLDLCSRRFVAQCSRLQCIWWRTFWQTILQFSFSPSERSGDQQNMSLRRLIVPWRPSSQPIMRFNKETTKPFLWNLQFLAPSDRKKIKGLQIFPNRPAWEGKHEKVSIRWLAGECNKLEGTTNGRLEGLLIGS